eukprot:5425656-Amphidinium_carterae.1
MGRSFQSKRVDFNEVRYGAQFSFQLKRVDFCGVRYGAQFSVSHVSSACQIMLSHSRQRPEFEGA